MLLQLKGMRDDHWLNNQERCWRGDGTEWILAEEQVCGLVGWDSMASHRGDRMAHV